MGSEVRRGQQEIWGRKHGKELRDRMESEPWMDHKESKACWDRMGLMAFLGRMVMKVRWACKGHWGGLVHKEMMGLEVRMVNQACLGHMGLKGLEVRRVSRACLVHKVRMGRWVREVKQVLEGHKACWESWGHMEMRDPEDRKGCWDELVHKEKLPWLGHKEMMVPEVRMVSWES